MYIAIPIHAPPEGDFRTAARECRLCTCTGMAYIDSRDRILLQATDPVFGFKLYSDPGFRD